MHHTASAPFQQRSSLHPFIWVVYLIALICIAQSFSVPDYAAALPFAGVSHFAQLFGIASFDLSPCSGNCGLRKLPSGSPLHNNLNASGDCASISINPDLQSGCGFGIDPVPSSGPSPEADLSAAPSETLTTSAEDPVTVGYRPPSASRGLTDAAFTP
jgi:hypothetical protein